MTEYFDLPAEERKQIKARAARAIGVAARERLADLGFVRTGSGPRECTSTVAGGC